MSAGKVQPHSPGSNHSMMSTKKPEVEHIISDHAGTVLDEPEPSPSLTRQEEKRCLRAYQRVLKKYVSDGLASRSQAAAAAATTTTGDGGGAHGGGEGGDDGDEAAAAEAARKAAAEKAAAAAREAAEKAMRARLGSGLTLEGVGEALALLDVQFNDAQFKRHVKSFFKEHDIVGSGGEPARLEMEGFLALASVILAPGHKFGSRLRKACSRADDGRCADLLARGCNPLGCDGGGFTALHCAAQAGHVSTLELLLDFAKRPPPGFVKLLPVEAAGGDGTRGLARTTAVDSTYSDRGGGRDDDEDDDDEDGGGGDASGATEGGGGEGGAEGGAVAAGDQSVVEAAQGDEAQPLPSDKKKGGNGNGPSQSALAFGRYYCALLEARDRSGWSPLLAAAAAGRASAVDALVAAGANVHGASAASEGAQGRTALHWAAAKGHEEVVGALVKQGCDVNGEDGCGWTPLHCAALHGHVKVCIALLTKHKADRLLEDRLGKAPDAYAQPGVWGEVLDAVAPKKRGHTPKTAQSSEKGGGSSGPTAASGGGGGGGASSQGRT